jgi:hypothetical protein
MVGRALGSEQGGWLLRSRCESTIVLEKDFRFYCSCRAKGMFFVFRFSDIIFPKHFASESPNFLTISGSFCKGAIHEIGFEKDDACYHCSSHALDQNVFTSRAFPQISPVLQKTIRELFGRASRDRRFGLIGGGSWFVPETHERNVNETMIISDPTRTNVRYCTCHFQ